MLTKAAALGAARRPLGAAGARWLSAQTTHYKKCDRARASRWEEASAAPTTHTLRHWRTNPRTRNVRPPAPPRASSLD